MNRIAEQVKAAIERARLGLKRGCCSAISPCSHQQADPNTICDTCAHTAIVMGGSSAHPS